MSAYPALVLIHAEMERGNRVGSLRTFAKARDRLATCPTRYLGFDVAGERARLDALCEALEAGTCAGLDPAPVWRFDGLMLDGGQLDGAAAGGRM